MTIRARKAQRVCNQKEFDLFKDSRRVALGQLDLKQLQKRDARAGKSLALSHSRAAAAKEHFENGDISGREYAIAAGRVEVMEQVKGRFDRRLKHALMARTEREQAKTRKSHVPVERQLNVTSSAKSKRARKFGKARQAELEDAGNQRIQGHLSSRDRRAQILNDRKH